MAGSGANGAGPVLVVELTAALDGTPGAWDGWDAADDRTRELFAAWVAKSRRGSVCQARADWTAYYAAHGSLRHAVVRSGPSDLGEELAGEAAEAVAVSLASRLVRVLVNLIN